MNALREYLFRFISGAVLSAILLSLPLRQTVRKVLTLSCGCLLILLAVSPLYQADISALTDSLPSLFDIPEVAEKGSNDELLQSLICQQTEELIAQKAAEFGIAAEASVKLRYDEAVGSYLPDAVTVTVTGSERTLEPLRQYITQELAIAEERQTWKLN